MLKTCPKCGAEHEKTTPGLVCRVCSRNACRIYTMKNKESESARHKKYFAANRDRIAKSIRKRKYGLVPELYTYLLKKQNGVCAICKQPETRITKGSLCRLSVDHNHKTGTIRGLLCTKCNSAIGYLQDDLSIAKTLLSYLTQRIDPSVYLWL